MYPADDPNILFTASDISLYSSNIINYFPNDKTRIGQYCQSIHFIPDAKLLLYILPSNTLKLFHLDIQAELEKSGIDYLYNVSSPVSSVRKGQKFSYQLNVRSHRGGVVYKIDKGPEGMTISKTGLVEWQVPANYEEDTVNAIISYSDTTGQNRIHPFKFRIEL